MNIEKVSKKNLKEARLMEYELSNYSKRFDKNVLINKSYKKMIEKMFRKNMKNKNAFYVLLKDDEKYVGYLTGWINKKKPWQKKRIASLCDCYVRPSYRNKGLATFLLKEFERWLKKKGIEYVELSVSENNDIGKKTWVSKGFKPANIRMRKEI